MLELQHPRPIAHRPEAIEPTPTSATSCDGSYGSKPTSAYPGQYVWTPPSDEYASSYLPANGCNQVIANMESSLNDRSIGDQLHHGNVMIDRLMYEDSGESRSESCCPDWTSYNGIAAQAYSSSYPISEGGSPHSSYFERTSTPSRSHFITPYTLSPELRPSSKWSDRTSCDLKRRNAIRYRGSGLSTSESVACSPGPTGPPASSSFLPDIDSYTSRDYTASGSLDDKRFDLVDDSIDDDSSERAFGLRNTLSSLGSTVSSLWSRAERVKFPWRGY